MPNLVAAEGNPDTPGCLYHFTGRVRRASDPVPEGVPPTPDGRLSQILSEGWLRASVTFGTSRPVICFSELSDVALRYQFHRGFTSRGPYEPWALVLRRDELVDEGARPVWYMDDEELAATRNLPPHLRDRRVRSVPGDVVDWTHEREWRICFGEWPPPGDMFGYELVRGSVIAAIVGRSGWRPPTLARALTGRQVERWLWTGEDLVDDGYM